MTKTSRQLHIASARDQIIAARMKRNARIDALKVDRSRYDGVRIVRSPEDEAGERLHGWQREDATIADRLTAFRRLLGR